MLYKEAINGILQQILYTNNDFGKVYKRGGSIEACNDFFLNEIIGLNLYDDK